MYAPNIWPQRPHDFKQIMVTYYDAMMGLASHVLRAMAMALDVDENYFADKFDRQASVCRIIRYPAVKEPPLPGQLRAGTHTDYGIMTFVRGDDTPGGLQVKHRNGDWIDVHIPPNAFVCNIGDLMMRWSNDRWVSTLHRVAVPPPDAVPQDRISLVFFTNPNPDAEIRCLDKCVAAGRDGEISAGHGVGALPRQADAGRPQQGRRQGRGRADALSVDRIGRHRHAGVHLKRPGGSRRPERAMNSALRMAARFNLQMLADERQHLLEGVADLGEVRRMAGLAVAVEVVQLDVAAGLLVVGDEARRLGVGDP